VVPNLSNGSKNGHNVSYANLTPDKNASVRVLFAYFPTEKDGFLCLSQQRFSKYRGDATLMYPVVPATGLTMLKQAGYEVFFLDCIYDQLTPDQFMDRIRIIQPDLIVYETKTPVIMQNWRMVDRIKKENPDVKIAVCGDHVSVLPEESMMNSKVDYILMGGDFDVAMFELVKFMEGKRKTLPEGVFFRNGKQIKNTGQAKLIPNLDDLPFIDRDIIPWQNYGEGWRLHDEFMYSLASRGCVYKCSFCSWPQMLYNNTVRFKSVKNTVDEMEFDMKKYGVKEIFFDDDTFTYNRQWVFDFCKDIKQRGLNIRWGINGRVDNTDKAMCDAMADAGCSMIKYGIESGSQRTLDTIHKGYKVEDIYRSFKLSKEAGILRHGTTMIGYPWETKQDMWDTINLVKALDVDTIQFSIPVAYPGTKLFSDAVKHNWLRFKPGDWEKFDMAEPSLINENMSSEEIVEMCKTAFREVYFSPKFIMHKFYGMRNPTHVRWIYRGVKTVVGGHIAGLSNSLDYEKEHGRYSEEQPIPVVN